MTPGRAVNLKPFLFSASLIVLAALLFGCGRKGPPTLKEFAVPDDPSSLRVVHREDAILVSWSYPGAKRQALKGFEVVRSRNTIVEKRTVVASSESSFVDHDFDLGTDYTYTVVTRNLKDVLSAGQGSVSIRPQAVPPPSDSVQAVVKHDSIELSWSTSGEGVCYNLYKTMESERYGERPVNAEPLCALTFRDRVLQPERSVYYTVRGVRVTPARDEGPASLQVEVHPSRFVPAPPADLWIVKSETRTVLMWEENQETWIKGYRIYRRVEGEAEFRPIGESRLPTFTDTDRTDGKAWYTVKAIGPIAESDAVTGAVAP